MKIQFTNILIVSSFIIFLYVVVLQVRFIRFIDYFNTNNFSYYWFADFFNICLFCFEAIFIEGRKNITFNVMCVCFRNTSFLLIQTQLQFCQLHRFTTFISPKLFQNINPKLHRKFNQIILYSLDSRKIYLFIFVGTAISP